MLLNSRKREAHEVVYAMCCNVEQTWGMTSCIQFTVVQSKFGRKGGSPMEKNYQIMEVQMNVEKLVYKLPNEKEVVYGALDKRTDWETKFLVIVVSKALKIFKKGKKLSTSAFLPICGGLLQAQG
ncbi:Pentatricopeptide repeat-containing protein, chloroplastic [Glycine max]|nr:Pentatricopeptide repeat-containing protein, chloroplastic [Glycine max]